MSCWGLDGAAVGQAEGAGFEVEHIYRSGTVAAGFVGGGQAGLGVDAEFGAAGAAAVPGDDSVGVLGEGLLGPAGLPIKGSGTR